MKKITFFFLLAISVSLLAEPEITTLWELKRNAEPSSTLPVWLDNTARCLAYGKIGENNRVVVVTRYNNGTSGSNAVKVLDAADGSHVRDLILTGISGGAAAINEVGITTDGKILVGNLISGSGDFKVYMWTDDGATTEPVNIISCSYATLFGTTTSQRMGDRFVVKGSMTDGSAKIYGSVGGSATVTQNSKVLVWEMEADLINGGFKFKNNPESTPFFSIPTTTYLTCVSTVNIPGVGTYWKNHNQGFKFKSDAGVVTDAPSAIFQNNSNTLLHVGDDNTDVENKVSYLACYTYNNVASPNQANSTFYVKFAKVVNHDFSTLADVITGGLKTPIIGGYTDVNSGTYISSGDLDMSFSGSDPVIYVIAPNNGIGAYKVTGLIPAPITTNTENVPTRRLIYTRTSDLLEVNAKLKEIKLYNLQGAFVRNSYSGKLNVNGLSGVYILKVVIENGDVENIKVIL